MNTDKIFSQLISLKISIEEYFSVKIKNKSSVNTNNYFDILIKQIDELILLWDAYKNPSGNKIVDENILVQKELQFKNYHESQMLRSLIDLMPDYIYIKDIHSHFLFANIAESKLVGVNNSKELIGKSDADFFPNHLSKKYYNDEQNILKSGNSLIGIEEQSVDSAGNSIWTLTTKVPIRDNNGKIIAIAGIGRDITERKKTEDALHIAKKQLEEANRTLEIKVQERTETLAASEERYRITIEKTDQVIYDYLIKEDKIKWQGAIRKITGYNPSMFQKLFSGSIIDLIHPDDRKFFNVEHNSAKKKLKPFHLEYRIKRKDGKYVFIQDNGLYFEDPKDGIRAIGAIADVSSRKIAEMLNEIKERNSRLQKDIALKANDAANVEELITSAMELISKYNKCPLVHAINIYNNKYFFNHSQSLWYSPKISKYNRIIETYKQEEKVMLNPVHIKVFFNKNSYLIRNLEQENEYSYKEIVLKSGLKSLFIFPIFISGQVVSLIELFSDNPETFDNNFPENAEQIGIQLGIIIDRKSSEEELKKLSMAIEQNQASVVISNSKGIIEYTNPKFSEISGYNSEEAIGEKNNLLKSGTHQKDFYKDLWNTIKAGKIWQGEICNKKKNGQFFWEQVNISPIKNSKGDISHFVAVKIDITDKKSALEELKIAKESAESANKAKSEFLANMSHEIRTPMNSILGFTELLSTKIIDEQQRNYLESIKSSGKNLLMLINDVLDLSKVDAGRMVLNKEIIDPMLLFKDIEYLFSLKAKEKGLEFYVQTDLKLPIGIETDEIRLRQILINLIGNAIKFTDQGYVKVAVKCMNHTLLNNEIFVDLQIRVEDSGIGMEKKFMEKLFTPFTQQDGQSTKKYGGTGLGLSITKRLIELFNGTITAESEIGKGSCFMFILHKIKASEKKIDSTEIITINPKNIHFNAATIIVADDIDNNRKYLKSILEDTNLNIIESRNGLETYEIALANKPKLIITDLKMPGIDGFELLKKIRNNSVLKNIPVIATTASASIEEREKVLVHNFSGILIKPIQINDVFLELIRFLEHKIIEEKNDSDKMNENIAITAIADADIRIVRRILENDLFRIWETFKNQQPLSDVEDFAYKMRDMGKKYNLEILISYGNRLLTSINNFDIDTMLKALKDYPKLLTAFKESE